MISVLNPGGRLVLADIAHHAEYRERLAARGLADIRVWSGAGSPIIGALSGGSFRPQAIGRRA